MINMKKLLLVILLWVWQNIIAISNCAAVCSMPNVSETNSNTRTYYQFVNVSNGVCTPAANQRLPVTFNDDGSVTIGNRRWTYSSSIGLMAQAGWVSGSDYITISSDYSLLQYNHQELIGGMVYAVTSFVIFSSHENTQENMLAYCNFLNSSTQQSAGGSNGGNTYNQPTQGKRCTKTSISDYSHCGGNGKCARCNGKGYYTDYSYGKKKNHICPTCNGTKQCPACNGKGFR